MTKYRSPDALECTRDAYVPAWIIEELERRERESRRDERPYLELPLPMPSLPAVERSDESPSPTRGVIVIDL